MTSCAPHRTASSPPYIFGLFALMFATSLLASTVMVPPALAESPTGEESSENVEEQLRELARLSQRLRFEIREAERRTLSSHPLTIDEALRQVRGGKTAAHILGWVQENIAFEPYTGALRGPLGVLAAGSGNSVDQALLLAAMFEAAGIESRFVTGTVYPRDTISLLNAFAGRGRLLTSSSLAVTGVKVVDGGDFSQYVGLVPHHIWLEAREGGGFRAADPVLGPAYGVTPAVVSLRSEDVPEMYTTSLQIDLVARLTDEQEQTLLTASGPLARYAYRALALGFRPDPARKGNLRPFFTLEGKSIRGKPLPPAQLDVLELRYRLNIGRRESRWTQVLYRRTGEIDLFAFDQPHYAIAIIPGWTSDDQVARLANESMKRTVARIDAWIAEARKNPAGMTPEALRETLHEVLDELGPLFPFAFSRHLDRMTFRLADSLGVRPIMQSPRIVTTAIVRQGDRYVVDVDVQGDVLEAVPMQGVPPGAVSGFLTVYGRLKDQLKGAVLEQTTGRRAVTVDSLFRQVRRQGVAFTTIHADTVDHLKLLDIDEVIRAELRDLVVRRGQIVLAPTGRVKVDDIPYYGWWSLHPLTGILQGTTHDALLSLRVDEAADVELPAIVASTLALSARLYRGITQATEDSAPFQGVICQARQDVQTISRALCATQKAHDLPQLSACLAGRQAPESVDPLAFSRPSCDDQVGPTRCGAVIASAFLDGHLTVLQDKHAEALQRYLAQEGAELEAFRPPDAWTCGR